MTKRKAQRGASVASLLVGISLLSITIMGAISLLGTSLSAQTNLSTNSLVDQVNRIGEIVGVHLNRGGSFKNPFVEAKGIQICSMQENAMICAPYQSKAGNFCLSIPSRVSIAGQDEIKVTGFRLFNGTFAQRDLNNVDMQKFQHRQFCSTNAGWVNLNNKQDFEFTNIRFCRFSANTLQQATQNYEANCPTVLENTPQSNMFWVALFKAEIKNGLAQGQYEEARIIQLLNTTRVRNGS